MSDNPCADIRDYTDEPRVVEFVGGPKDGEVEALHRNLHTVVVAQPRNTVSIANDNRGDGGPLRMWAEHTYVLGRGFTMNAPYAMIYKGET